MLTDVKKIVKRHENDIIILIAVILVSLLSFALGYIIGELEEKEPINIEHIQHEQKNF